VIVWPSTLPAADAPPFVLSLPFVRRQDEAALRLSTGEDLVISLEIPDSVSTTTAHWSLALKASCASGPYLVSQSAQSWPPVMLTVGWAILERSVPPAFDACLRVVISSAFDDPGYQTRLNSVTDAKWQVEISNDPRP
jgi:hypothetical protein